MIASSTRLSSETLEGHWVFRKKVVFDYRTNQKLQKKQLFLLMLSFAILAIWRKEGIYLLVFAPLIICSVYKIQTVRNIVKTFKRKSAIY